LLRRNYKEAFRMILDQDENRKDIKEAKEKYMEDYDERSIMN
jgi:tRNA(Glu) U13 pseudouridine synthase TruD